jgi:glutamine synthetase
VQLHPEYAAGQYELSYAEDDPLGAADTLVLVREVIRSVSLEHELRASFSPKVLADGVGNGGHVHLSLWRGEFNLMTGGELSYGMSAPGESFAAGILDRLPALLAVGCPTVASYLRLIPSHWAGAFQCWGLENREAALRFITGPVGQQSTAANLEVKCFDGAANPYLALAVLLAAGTSGLAADATLPEPVGVDPGALLPAERAARQIAPLPGSLEEAVRVFEIDPVLRDALGEVVVETIADVRRGEISLLADASPEEIVARTRWRH